MFVGERQAGAAMAGQVYRGGVVVVWQRGRPGRGGGCLRHVKSVKGRVCHTQVRGSNGKWGPNTCVRERNCPARREFTCNRATKHEVPSRRKAPT